MRASIAVGAGLLAAACATAPVDPPPEDAPLVLSADAELVYARTLTRDEALSCEALEDGVADPAAVLLEVAEEVTAPPASGMRAAACLIEGHASEVEDALIRWVSQRRYMGLGLLVLNQLNELEPGLRARVIEAARRGQYASIAERRIERARETPSLDDPSGVTN